ncbi:MAG: hypothetical protein K2X03_04365 [Bryobacteraceae bacterium]|nr:hypothetical protein [Bryobacteraceae bacterium]
MRLVWLALLLLAGCAKPPEPTKPVTYFEPDPATAATITGRVRFVGKLPPQKLIRMDAEAACEQMNPGLVPDGSLSVSKGDNLNNVFVYVKSGLEGKTFAPPDRAVTLVQKGCQFQPRVMALRKGQTLKVANADPVTHSIHPQPQNNREWNQQQAPGAPDLERRFGFPEVMIPVKCNVHAWMRSYIAVLEHPYFDVTQGLGEFRLVGLPPGNYVVAAWHERFGEITQPLTVGVKQTATLDFTYPKK